MEETLSTMCSRPKENNCPVVLIEQLLENDF